MQSPALDTLRALADESRLRLLHVLSLGSFNVQELTSILGLGQSTMSHHLKILQHAGLTRRKRQGTWTYYQLANGEGTPLAHQVIKTCLDLPVISPGDDLVPQLTDDHTKTLEILNQRRDQSQQFFEAIGKKWSEIRPTIDGEEKITDKLISLITPSATLLELGCGAGALLEKITPRQGSTIAVDYSPSMLDAAKKHLGDRAKTIDFRLGYLEHLPLADASVDLTVAYMVFHHLADPKAALKEVWRVLRKNGTLIVVDLSQHEKEEMREQFGDLWLGFDPKEFSVWAKDAGFSKVDCSSAGKKREVFFLTTTK